MDRKPYKRIAANFEGLLTDTGREGLREAVAANDADWYETAAALFDLGVAEWRNRRRNTAARNIAAALWWVWHKQREIADKHPDCKEERYMEWHAWDSYIMARDMIRAMEGDNAAR